MTPPLEDADLAAVRAAIACRNYPEGLRLWAVAVRRLENAIRSRSLTRERMSELRDFVDWSRKELRCAQAHDLVQLRTIHAATAYEARFAVGPRIIRTLL
ncbi:MAG TPA: hypothetical protein VE959_08375 [Bryobacteraceae bacterium]|nr:hypothetical protein [Bryobacteraceae bacterium]